MNRGNDGQDYNWQFEFLTEEVPDIVRPENLAGIELSGIRYLRHSISIVR